MSYSFQNFSVGEVLTSTKMNQIEVNVRDHVHGAASVVAIFAAATAMLFYQASAPTGWTAVALNDRLLRVVTAGGTGGSGGGATGFSTWAAVVATGEHTLTTTEMPAHTHPYKVVSGSPGGDGTSPSAGYNGVTGNTSSTGGDGSHTHPLSQNLLYSDVIVATKD